MAATQIVTMLEFTPGKLGEVSDAFREYRRVTESLGGKASFWVTVYGGPTSNRLVVVAEYADGEKAGAAMDHMLEMNERPFHDVQVSGAAKLVGRSVLSSIES